MEIQDKLEEIASSFDWTGSDDESSLLERRDIEYLNREYFRRRDDSVPVESESDSDWVDDDRDESLDETIVESDDEDKTVIQDAEPPAFLKSRTIVYLIKTVPAIIVFLVLVVIAKLASNTSFYDTDADFGLLHHKVRGLEKKLGDINDKLAEISAGVESKDHKLVEVLGHEVRQLKSRQTGVEEDLKKSVEGIVVAYFQDSLDAKLEGLAEKKLQDLQSVIETRLDHLGVDQIKEKTSSEVLDKVNVHISSINSQLDALQSTGYSRQELDVAVPQLVQHELNQRLEPRIVGTANFASYDRGARVVKKYTTLPKLQRVRTKALDRVLHGWLDFIKRNVQGHKRALTGLNNVELTSQENSPSNALVDNSQFWQALVRDLPITYGVRLSEPIYLRQAGIYHPQTATTLECAPKRVSLLVEAANSRDTKLLKSKMAAHYNQDLVFSNLRGLAKVSEFVYQTGSRNRYQTFPLPRQVLAVLEEYPIKSVALVVEDNWGHPDVLALYGLKVFGITETEMKTTRLAPVADEIRNLGEDAIF
ncbi:hypothetical protein OGAPHI_001066 [Ogataea philodendri]|uniref:SUN domain-containing protein n=1 Tax=Ogataea philodendri TaxID=1378263 RepID=A0A9P8T9Y8_9ASCO|nr:uncharacterized protein OGAPHI_001066 [Ogataea philodendri]KAH3670551.1 hypothetical protein OGAPHI_001066 [Ogataea philodendri]